MQSELSELNEKSARSSITESASKAQTLSLDAPGVANLVAERVLKEIDQYCVQTYDGGHRTHLGASLIGRSCKRYLWYVFRWCKHVRTTGRQQRLFNRGHREEVRFVEWLEGIGFKIWFEDYDSDPLYYCSEANAYTFKSELYKLDAQTNMLVSLSEELDRNKPDFKMHVAIAKLHGLEFKQYRISDCNGHFGGSLDGIAMFPPSWGIPEPVLLEFKTSGTGQKFNKLKDNKMPVEKPEHFAQTSTYGYKYGFKYVLYLCINKNDDDLHIEIAKLAPHLGEQSIAKAGQIIGSQTPPPKLAENPTFTACKFCDMLDICHQNASIERNCRSCVHAKPVEEGQWFCDNWVGCIPKDVIPLGCDSYKAIA